MVLPGSKVDPLDSNGNQTFLHPEIYGEDQKYLESWLILSLVNLLASVRCFSLED